MNATRTTTNVATTAARPVGAVVGGNAMSHPITSVKESFVRSEFAQGGGLVGAAARGTVHGVDNFFNGNGAFSASERRATAAAFDPNNGPQTNSQSKPKGDGIG